MVMIKTHTPTPFEPLYKGYYRIVSFKGNQIGVAPSEGGKSHFVHKSDVKYVLPADAVIEQIPNTNTFGRQVKFALNPNKVEDLKWSLSTKLNTIYPTINIEIPEKVEIKLKQTQD